MPRLRLILDDRTFAALAKEAVAELRPIPWQAEVILRSHLRIEPRRDQPTGCAPQAMPSGAEGASNNGRP